MIMSEVDKSKCITCGLCFSTHADLFVLGADGKAEALKQPGTPEEQAAFEEAMWACPVEAISVGMTVIQGGQEDAPVETQQEELPLAA